MYHSLLIYSPSKGLLDCFQVLAVMNKAAINSHGQGFRVDIRFQLTQILNTKVCNCWITQ